MANLSYIRNFCFSHSSKDELSYCLSTFEAAVEYINLGKLQDTRTVSPPLRPVRLRRPHRAEGRPCCLLQGQLDDKALFRERMSLLSQSAATPPILCLFEVSSGTRTRRPATRHQES